MTAGTTRALFLDRDGVINKDKAYVYRQSDFEFIPGIFDLCRNATEKGYLLFVVTNQAGIGRGYYTEHDFDRLTQWMCGMFAREGAAIANVYYCPTHPIHGLGSYKRESAFRKPNPGMILQASREFSLNLSASLLVGDKESDMQAGMAAGVGTNLLFLDAHRPAVSHKIWPIISDLRQVIEYL